MMLQLQRCGEARHDAWQVLLKLPLENTRPRTRKIARLHARAENDVVLSSSLSSNETGRDVKVSLVDRWKGLTGSLVAAPRFPSLLWLTGRRDQHELRMETRERVFLSISDWVSRRVHDPLVEIDPVTVSMAIQAEKQATNNAAATSTIPVSMFGYHPPFLPGRVRKDTLAAIILFLLVALVTAAILAMRGKQKPATNIHTAGTIGSSANGDARLPGDENPAPALNNMAGDNGLEKPGIAPASSFPGQFTRPSSNSSTLPDQSGLPLPQTPPLPEVITEDKTMSESCSAEEISSLSIPEAGLTSLVGDPPVSFIVNDDDVAHAVRDQIQNVETDVITVTIDEEIASSNGGIVTSITPEGTDNVELGSASSLTEPTIEQLPPSAAESISFGESPLAAESLVEFLSEEYMLRGDSESLSPIARPATVDLNVASPAAANPILGPPVAAVWDGNLPAQPPSPSGWIGGESPAIVDGNLAPQLPSPSGSIGGKTPAIEDGNSVGSLGFDAPELRPPLAVLRPITETPVVVEDRQEYVEVLKKVLPAASVGAGVAALSAFSGVDGAFQMIGLFATTSFLTSSIIWAGERQQLVEEISNIKDHSQLMDFLRVRKII